jgi:hypothetical protein
VSLGAIGALSLLRHAVVGEGLLVAARRPDRRAAPVDPRGARRDGGRAAHRRPLLPAAPVGLPLVVALFAFTIAAATQDVAVDAYTIELLAPGEEGVANGVRVSAYRAALIFAGGVLVWQAGLTGWPVTFRIAAVGLLALAVVAGRAPSTAHRPQPPRVWARSLRAWVSRPGAIPVFLFVLSTSSTRTRSARW